MVVQRTWTAIQFLQVYLVALLQVFILTVQAMGCQQMARRAQTPTLHLGILIQIAIHLLQVYLAHL
jgi:hypothetical protein